MQIVVPGFNAQFDLNLRPLALTSTDSACMQIRWLKMENVIPHLGE
jgi:hypothetical protein